MQERHLCWPPTFFHSPAVASQFFQSRIAIGNTLNLRSLCVCLIKSPLFHKVLAAQGFRFIQSCGWALRLIRLCRYFAS